MPGQRRYSELLQSLGNISPKVLAARLKFMEQESLITRTVYPVIPPHTEYALTDLGRQLQGVIDAMAVFGQHLPGVPDEDH